MLSNNEIEEISTSLRSMLNSEGFGWLLLQVEEEILRGREQIVSVKEINLNKAYLEAMEKKSIGSEKFVIAEAYTQQEELQLLINAVRKGICEPYRMVDATADTFRQIIGGKLEFVLVPERSDNEVVISVGQFQLLKEKALALSNLLSEIEKEMSDANKK
jgi:hypothetical protein